ncbi:MAG: hypothetical protein V4819_10890 [Verrucomicrobiota bacterium]
MARVKHAAPVDYPKLLEEWEKLFPEGDNYLEGHPENALRFFLAVWLSKDVEGFLKMVTARDYEYANWAAQVLVRAMPEKAAELIFGPERYKLNEHFVDEAAEELAERHPALYLMMNPDGSFDLTPGMTNDDWETAIANLAKTNTLAAANACLKSNYGNYYPSNFADAILEVAKAWKPGDPSMTDWVNGIADPKLRAIASQARLCALAEKDPRAALAELQTAKLGIENDLRYDARREILAQLAKVDLIEALKLVKTTESFFSKYKWGPFTESSPEAEAEKSANPLSQLGPTDLGEDELKNNGVRNAVLRSAAGNLPNNPAQFFGELHKLSASMGDGYSAWQRGIEAGLICLKSANWSAGECLAVAGMWDKELNGAQDDPTLQKLAARAVDVNPEECLSTLDRLPESVRPVFAGEIIKGLPDASPEHNIVLLSHLTTGQWDERLGEALGRNPAAYAKAIASLPAETTLKARESFMGKWGELDPEAAAKWLDSLPDDAASKPAAAGLASAWASYDEYAASNWAASLPAGPSRDAAAASLSSSLAREQFNEAWQWANSISNPSARDEAIFDLDSKWGYDAPQKFRAALDKVRRARGMTDRGPPPPDPFTSPSDSNDPFR